MSDKSVFGALIDLHEARRLPPLNELPTPHDYGEVGPWRLVINGDETEAQWRHVKIPPFHLYVEYNGWPAGFLNPYDGVIAAGTHANEATLIAALEAAAVSPSAGGQ